MDGLAPLSFTLHEHSNLILDGSTHAVVCLEFGYPGKAGAVPCLRVYAALPYGEGPSSLSCGDFCFPASPDRCWCLLGGQTKCRYRRVVVGISANCPVTVGHSGSRSISLRTVDPSSPPSTTLARFIPAQDKESVSGVLSSADGGGGGYCPRVLMRQSINRYTIISLKICPHLRTGKQ